MWIISKSDHENFFLHFFQLTHEVGMKNVVKCSKHFLGYFYTLETQGAYSLTQPMYQYVVLNGYILKRERAHQFAGIDSVQRTNRI